MPYITKHRRGLVVTQPAPRQGVNKPLDAGELTFQLTHVIEEYRRLKGDRFQTFSDIIGALEATKAEAYRRVVTPYEVGKCVLNGDVYAPVARIRPGCDEADGPCACGGWHG